MDFGNRFLFGAFCDLTVLRLKDWSIFHADGLFLWYNDIDKLEEIENGRQFSVGANEKEISFAIDSIVSFLGRRHVHVRTWSFFYAIMNTVSTLCST